MRGEVVSVFDLGYVLERKYIARHHTNMTLLCESKGLRVALLVDKIVGIRSIFCSQIIDLDDTSGGELVFTSIDLENENV